MSTTRVGETEVTTHPLGFLARAFQSFWRVGNFRKDNFLTSDKDFVPRSEALRNELCLQLAECRGEASPIVALPASAQAVIIKESRRAEEKFLLRSGFHIWVKGPIAIFFALCFGFPIYIAFRQRQWSFAIGSITSAPRSAELIFLYSRYAQSGLELLLTFFENRLWINMPPGITFSITESNEVASVKQKLWFLAAAAIFSTTLLLSGVLLRTWLWQRKLQRLAKLTCDLSEDQKSVLLSYYQTLDNGAQSILSMKEERGPDDPRGQQQKGASVPTAEMMDIGVLHLRRVLQVIAIFVREAETTGLYLARDKYRYYSVLIFAFILTVGLNYDQFMVIVDAIGKYIWTWIKVRRGVQNTDTSPASLGRTVSVIFIETIPSLILIGFLLRASGGTILDTWKARMAIGIALGITKTFFVDHVLELFFWVGHWLIWCWHRLSALAVALHLDAVARQLCRWFHLAAILLGLDKLLAFVSPFVAPLSSWFLKGALAILG
ncbi:MULTISPECIES: hypothetical protein [Agrobacterium]|uniref:Uncharacterized protein n=1 Tax=Agrobacterium tumefaciens TaxID=358 RepID=A0AAW8M2A1_AGRTU|nr:MULTISPECIES: hypothetical protein [Agrobacterium]MBP2568507.1 hypothetical protein [Agrobacterium tumefaciens]MDR6705357.1 hypothetical protein [Agrobacterium tumefaciens]TCV46358.1 hypothetical protein EDB97_11676 [Agrobacterium tumefaciens]